jgi:tetratricopeptide (TPR) repeat protein
MSTHAANFLADVEAHPDSPEAGVAHRIFGVTHWFAGKYVEARDHLERALALFQPGRDDNLAFQFGQDLGVAAMSYLAIALWQLGDVERAVSLIDGVQARAVSLTHVGTQMYARTHAALFELMRGNRVRATLNVLELARLTREHDLPMWRAFSLFFDGWTKSESGALLAGCEDMRRGADLLREQKLLVFDGLLKIAHAEAEARAGDPDRAISILDEALTTSERTGHRAFDGGLYRVRGDILLKRDPANRAPAEEAYLSAIAVAREQGARSFELLAALALAKLYQSTDRPAEGHTVLAPALEGFAPTAEMLEIAEAQTLLAALEETEEVKAEAAQRQRRLHLQTAYGNALFAARGLGAPETTEAFTRALESAVGVKDAPGRLAADYGLWVGSYVRAELSRMRADADAFLSDVEGRPDSAEAGVAHRAAGLTHWFAGEYQEAREHFERALALFQPGRDDDLAFRFGNDAGTAAMLYLALTLWPLGDIGRAISLVGDAEVRIAGVAHIGTRAHGRLHAALLALLRGDLSRATQKRH